MRSTVFGRPELSKKTLGLPKAWSHQDDLKAMIGKPIVIIQGAVVTVYPKLLAADAFTLKCEDNNKSALTLFKHAIQGYAPA